MIELLKKTILTGIGIAAMTKERIEELSHKISEEAKLSEEEGRELAADLLKESEKAKISLEQHVESMVKTVLEKLNIPSKKELDVLSSRIEVLEEKLLSEEREDE